MNEIDWQNDVEMSELEARRYSYNAAYSLTVTAMFSSFVLMSTM